MTAGLLTLRGADVEVVIDPNRGGRISSLKHLSCGREWLAQPQQPDSVPLSGARFTDGEMAGWDEMVPTIEACAYPVAGRHAGAALPDHGEAWSSPWRVVEALDAAVTLAVRGRVLPYELRRRVALASPTAVAVEYQLEVGGDEELAVLWAPHPQWDCSPGTSLVLPQDVTAMLDVTSGPPGRPLAWPTAHLSRANALPVGGGRKLYVPPPQAIGMVELRDPRGSWLRLSWDATLIPYFGVWLENRAFARGAVVVTEPTDGFFDSLARAVGDGRAARVAPTSTRRWELLVELGQGG